MSNLTKRLVESANSKKSISATKNSAEDKKAVLIESSMNILNTNSIDKISTASSKLSKENFNALKRLSESKNRREREKAAYTVDAIKRQKTVLENKNLKEATTTSGFQNLLPKLLDIVSVFYPEMIQTYIADLQPIDAQISSVFTIKPTYDTDADGVTAGDEVFINKTTHASYGSERRYTSLSDSSNTWTATVKELPIRPGSVKITVDGVQFATDDGNGVINGAVGGDNVTAGTVDYDTGAISLTIENQTSKTMIAETRVNTEKNITNNRKIRVDIKSLPVEAEPHILQADYSVQSALAATAHLDVDIAAETVRIIGAMFKSERDTYLTQILQNTATAKTELDFSKTVPSGVSRTVHYADIGLNIDLARSLIQDAMGRGDVDFILAGYDACNVFQAIPSFEKVDVRAPIGSYLYGYLDNGSIALVKSNDLAPGDFIIGYKGYVAGDSAVIVADWVPLYTAPELQLPSMRNEIGMASFYGVVPNNVKYTIKAQVKS